MKGLGFGQWTSSGFASSVADGGEASGRAIASAYMAMSDYLLLTAETPDADDAEVVAWVSKNLPRFFPDEPDRHPFDLLPRARSSGGNRQVLLTSAECLSDYRAAFPGLPLASLITAFREIEGDFVRVVAMPGWIEWASREGGVWTLGQRVDANGSFRAALSMILEGIGAKASPLPIQVVHAPEVEGELAEIAKSFDVRPLPLQRAFDLKRAKKHSHFDREGKTRAERTKALALACALALAFLAANVLLLGSGAADRNERRKNVAAAKALRTADTADKALLARRDALLSGSGAIDRPPSPTSILSALSLGLGRSARLIDFSEENGVFTANLETANALTSLSTLESEGGFEGLKISGIKSGDSGERFCLTGRYHEKR